MNFILQPWQLYFLILVGWINRRQQEVIEYLRTENDVPREYIGKKRILLTDRQRRRLAVKGKMLGRKRHATTLKWHKSSGASKRSMVENLVYRYKKIIGSEMRSRTLATQRVEHRIGCEILNKMTAMGMPDSYQVA